MGIRERRAHLTVSSRAGRWRRGQVTDHAHIPAQRCRRLEKTCRMSEALGLQVRGAKLRVGEPQNLGSQTDASDACVHAQSIANDSLILSRRTRTFRSHLGTYKRATCSPHTPKPQPSYHTNEPSDVARSARFRYRSAYRCRAAADHGANAEDSPPRSPEPDSLFSKQAPSSPHVRWCPP